MTPAFLGRLSGLRYERRGHLLGIENLCDARKLEHRGIDSPYFNDRTVGSESSLEHRDPAFFRIGSSHGFDHLVIPFFRALAQLCHRKTRNRHAILVEEGPQLLEERGDSARELEVFHEIVAPGLERRKLGSLVAQSVEIRKRDIHFARVSYSRNMERRIRRPS